MLAALLWGGSALAQEVPEPAPAPPPTEPAEEKAENAENEEEPAAAAEPPSEPGAPAEQTAAPGEASDERLRALEEQNRALREELEYLQEDLSYFEKRLNDLLPVEGELSGYLDFGFFAVSGDGSGIRSDLGHLVFPEYEDVVADSWVFMGDPLSTAVNARGEPASTGDSRAITFDAIDSDSSSFIVNSLNLALFAEVGEHVILTGKVDFLPRGRDVSDPDGVFLGDFVDVRLAYAEYRAPLESVPLSLFVGKFDSVVGFEYRTQEAPARVAVTPSLICRYTCGYPLGIKARTELFDRRLVLNVAVTNGGHFAENFPFQNEIDANHFKSAAGRLSYIIPFAGELEIGASGIFGAQDAQPEEDIYQWMFGFDLHYERDDFILKGEFVQGRAKGESLPGEAPCGVAPCLEFKGAYGLLGYRVTNAIMPFVRVDWRDALHQAGASFVYISKLWRGTGGLNLRLNPNLIIKAEYTVNRELGRIPQFANNVFTSALVVKY